MLSGYKGVVELCLIIVTFFCIIQLQDDLIQSKGVIAKVDALIVIDFFKRVLNNTEKYDIRRTSNDSSPEEELSIFKRLDWDDDFIRKRINRKIEDVEAWKRRVKCKFNRGEICDSNRTQVKSPEMFKKFKKQVKKFQDKTNKLEQNQTLATDQPEMIQSTSSSVQNYPSSTTTSSPRYTTSDNSTAPSTTPRQLTSTDAPVVSTTRSVQSSQSPSRSTGGPGSSISPGSSTLPNSSDAPVTTTSTILSTSTMTSSPFSTTPISGSPPTPQSSPTSPRTTRRPQPSTIWIIQTPRPSVTVAPPRNVESTSPTSPPSQAVTTTRRNVSTVAPSRATLTTGGSQPMNNPITVVATTVPGAATPTLPSSTFSQTSSETLTPSSPSPPSSRATTAPTTPDLGNVTPPVRQSTERVPSIVGNQQPVIPIGTTSIDTIPASTSVPIQPMNQAQQNITTVPSTGVPSPIMSVPFNRTSVVL